MNARSVSACPSNKGGYVIPKRKATWRTQAMAHVRFLMCVPKPFSNYIVIEKTATGAYRFEGASDMCGGEPAYCLSPRCYADLEDAKREAEAWAEKYRVTDIYLPNPDGCAGPSG